ncbi:hypothetical protein ACFLX4_00005, partial [Chloroflexota bacterium]
RNINQKFIVGAVKAFPGYKFEDLFYLAPEMPAATNNHHWDSAKCSLSKPAVDEKQKKPSSQQAVGVT